MSSATMILMSKVAFALILLCLGVVSSFTPWPQGSIITNASTSFQSSNGLTSRLPPLPSGFEIESGWDSSLSLNPLSVYVVAIRLMYGFSIQPWRKRVELVDSGLDVVVQSPNYNVIIYTSDPGRTTDLTTGFCVRALYKAINCMATREPGFYESTTYVVKDGEPIGRILITTVGFPRVSSNGAVNVSESTFTRNRHDYMALRGRTTTSAPSSTPTADSGEIVDPDDSRFKIRYEFRGQQIPAGDIFNAAIDGLALAAQYDYGQSCEYITALSVSGKVVWHIGRSTEEGISGWEISHTFFVLINDLFLVQRRFQEVWFYVDFDGANLADGYVLKWNPGDERNGMERSEKVDDKRTMSNGKRIVRSAI